MEHFCLNLREHAAKIINYQKKEMISLTAKEIKPYHKQKVCYICKKGFSTDNDNKKCHKVKDHCHYTRKYTKHQNIFLSYFIMVLRTIIILLSKS